MKLPFVSRDRYDEMRALLERQIASLDAERQKLIDHVQVLSVGRPVFAAEPPAKEPEKKHPVTPNAVADDPDAHLVREAIRMGYKRPNQIAAYVTRAKQIEQDLRIKNATTPLPENPDFEAAISEGRQEARVPQ